MIYIYIYDTQYINIIYYIGIYRTQLQLYGCGCLWIASKYHEIYAPELTDFIYISDNAFEIIDLKNCEAKILSTLNYNITYITHLSFIELYMKLIAYPLRTNTNKKISTAKTEKDIERHKIKLKNKLNIISNLTFFLIEHCLMDYNLITQYSKSIIVSSVLAYACLVLGVKTALIQINTNNINKDIISNTWSNNLIKYTGYNIKQLIPIMKEIDILRNNEKHKAIRNKYARKNYYRVSCIDFENINIMNKYFSQSKSS